MQAEKKRNLVLTDFIANIKAKEKNQIFYIVTTKQYTARNRYKFGGCKSKDLLKSNLAVYNRGKAKNDKHYYVFIKDCYDFKSVENIIKSAMPIQFKDAQCVRNELIHCHYSIFKTIVEMAIDNMDSFTDEVSKLIKDMIEMTTHGEPMDPPPIELGKQAVLTITENGEEIKTAFDMDTMSEDDILDGIKEALSSYAADKGQEYIYDNDKDTKELDVIWKTFKPYIGRRFNIPMKFFKAMFWRQKIKDLNKNGCQLNMQWIQRVRKR